MTTIPIAMTGPKFTSFGTPVPIDFRTGNKSDNSRFIRFTLPQKLATFNIFISEAHQEFDSQHDQSDDYSAD